MGNPCLAAGSGFGAVKVDFAPGIKLEEGRLAIPIFGMISSIWVITRSSSGIGCWSSQASALSLLSGAAEGEERSYLLIDF